MKFNSKTFLRVVALASLLQGGCISSTHTLNETLSNSSVQGKSQIFSMDGLTDNEKKSIQSFMDDYAQKSPSARKLLKELADQGTRLNLFRSDLGAGDIFHAGLSNENELGLNREIKKMGVSFADTFFHEGEHVVHLKHSHKNGINAHSFSSLNDVYIYATLLEALAYRKAALCCGEYDQKLSRRELEQKVENVFKNRLSTATKYMEERLTYERDAIIMANSETNTLPNQVYFNKNPDWNKIASILSRGEVKKVSTLPQPTLLFLSACLYKELDKHPNAASLDDLDISCALTNQSKLQKDQKEIKALISSLLIEVYDLCQKSDKPLSDEMMYSFLYTIGWPTSEQQKKIDQKKIDFEVVRDINLSKFGTGELFDRAIALLNTPEVQSHKIPKFEIYPKVLKFEKMILVPSKSGTRIKQKER